MDLPLTDQPVHARPFDGIGVEADCFLCGLPPGAYLRRRVHPGMLPDETDLPLCEEERLSVRRGSVPVRLRPQELSVLERAS